MKRTALVLVMVVGGCGGGAQRAPVANVARGHDGTEFKSDRAANRVYAVRDGESQPLVELQEPGPLLLNGGQLVIGDATGLHALDLKSGELTTIAATGPVLGVALDHIGYYVVRTDVALLRVTPDGRLTQLPLPAGGARGRLDFDPVTRTLIVLDDAGSPVARHDYVALTGEDASRWAAADALPMKSFEMNGFVLESAEYWPYHGDQDIDYPADVLWGFYPEKGVVFEGAPAPASASPVAVACAKQAYDELQAFLATDPPLLHQAVTLGTSNRFYLWTNDYSRAAKPFPPGVRPNKLWYWERKPAVMGRIPGFWKWESTVTQDGECLTPDPAQAAQYLEEKVRELQAN